MRKNGFTLIELLAVIVILAIIALIATPIILGIINDARKESQERSAELYLSAVDLAVVKRNMTEGFTPEECTITEGIVNCTGYEEPLKVEVDGETPISGTIKFENNKATMGTILTFKDFTATLDEERKIVIGEIENSVGTFEIGKLSSVCEPAETQYFEDTPMEPGYEYNCKVDPNAEPYTFYVLNKTDNQINLIMDRNINSDGTIATTPTTKSGDSVYNVVYSWSTIELYEELTGKDYNEEDFNDTIARIELGPILPMRFLVEATKNWTNLNSMTIDTYENVSSPSPLAESYISYARLPKSSEINAYNAETQVYAYLYDNLKLTNECYNEDGSETISCNFPAGLENTTFNSYFTQSYAGSSELHQWVIQSSPVYTIAPLGWFAGEDASGIRPVITLDIQ